ncbi:chromosomal replication initiation ATPase DnaA [Aminobacter niigataensis]|uniref:Chromosomal replication initiation ATPase DnaA n=1 Tax=Aminobacter niigataensis TaxID=83265 RepID=A0ABR6L817_9HYPH|nr:hypothetical protein [Aminobacter niigataensis]MBB4652947.1 chromosomal replication initiation ATPase DnaA [Aminobacter niigataensis]
MLHSPSFLQAQRRNAAIRQWADAEIERLRAAAAAKLRADARRDWQIYCRLANIPRPVPRTPAREIIDRVAAWHQVPVSLVLSDDRHRVVVEARFDAIAAVKLAYPGMTSTRLAQTFGRHHTTILDALKRRGLSCLR